MLITRAELKDHLNIEDSVTAYDTLLDEVILAAIKFMEGYTGRTLTQIGIDSPAVYATQNLHASEVKTDKHGSQYLELEAVPILSIQSIQYIDVDGAAQTWSSSLYELDTERMYGRVYPVYGEDMPSVRSQRAAFVVTYDAGYTEAAGLPKDLWHAGKMLAASFFYNRENDATLTIKSVPLGAERLMAPYKIRKV